MTVLEQLRKTIEDGHPGETEKLVREALKQHIPAGRIVEEAMTPAMRTVGENYKSNGADIIKILAAARSVRKGFELLVRPNQEVKAGDVLWNADLKYIKDNALDENIIVVFTKIKDGAELEKKYGKMQCHDMMLRVKG